MRSAAPTAWLAWSRIVERRVPEGHQAVADEFVDRAAAFEHDFRKRRKQPVDQGRELLGIILQRLGNRGEAAHIAEKNGQRPPLAAEFQLRGIVGKSLDQSRRKVSGKGAGDVPATAPLCGIIKPGLARNDADIGKHRADGARRRRGRSLSST